MSPSIQEKPVPCLCGDEAFVTWTDLAREIFVVKCSDPFCLFMPPKTLTASNEADAVRNWDAMIHALRDSVGVAEIAELRAEEIRQ